MQASASRAVVSMLLRHFAQHRALLQHMASYAMAFTEDATSAIAQCLFLKPLGRSADMYSVEYWCRRPSIIEFGACKKA